MVVGGPIKSSNLGFGLVFLFGHSERAEAGTVCDTGVVIELVEVIEGDTDVE